MRLVALLALVMASSCQGYVICGPHFRASVSFGSRSAAATPLPATPRTTVATTSAPSLKTTSSPKAVITTTTTTTTATPPPTTAATAATPTKTPTDTTTTSTTPAPPVTPKTPRAGGDVDSGVAGVAAALRRQLPANKNAVMSPLSIASVLAALQLGANGTTADQIATFLGQGSSTDGPYLSQLGSVLRAINGSTAVTASLANAVVLDKSLSLNPTYEQGVKRILSSEVLSVDFAGRPVESTDFLNRWVSYKTQSKIPKMLEQPLGPDTLIALASALYFNGAWNDQFQVNATRRAPFTVSDNEVVDVDMMFHETSVLFAWDEVTGAQVLGLPYKDEDFALFLVLPKEPGVSGLLQLEQQLSSARLIQLFDSVDWTELPYYVPRMRLEASFNLNDALIAAGVTDMFDAAKADLSGILNRNGSVPLFVSDVVHRVVMDITETGTEAAAATIATGSRSGSRYVFRVDRPFLFVLQHRRSGVPLFWGSVVRPTPNYPSTTKQ